MPRSQSRARRQYPCGLCIYIYIYIVYACVCTKILVTGINEAEPATRVLPVQREPRGIDYATLAPEQGLFFLEKGWRHSNH